MKELKELFSPKNENVASIVKIIAKHSSSAYIVQDIRQKRYVAESDGSYRIGQTAVVKNGVLVNKSKSLGYFHEFVV